MWGAFAVLLLQFSGAYSLHMGGLGNKKSELAHDQRSMGILRRIIDAYHSRKGLLVTVGPDISATALRDDVPWWLYPHPEHDKAEPSLEVQGIIFDPSSPPAVACAYPVDGNTGYRKPDRCSLLLNKRTTGRCTMPPSEFLNFDPKRDGWHGSGCYFDKVEDALEAQRAYWVNRTDPNNTAPILSSPYNEIIVKLSDPPSNIEISTSVGWMEELQEHIIARFWAHAGPFRMPTKQDAVRSPFKNVPSACRVECRLEESYNCSSSEISSKLPLFEFAELWGTAMPSLDRLDPDRQGIKYTRVDSSEIIREIDPATFSACDCP